MRISEWGLRECAALAVTAAIAVSAGVLFFDGERTSETAPAAQFSSAEQAYMAGKEALSDDNIARALPALRFAADRGMFGAQLRLGRIYGDPDGKHHDDAEAVTYYHMAINQHGNIDRLHPAAKFVAEAVRRLAQYYRQGVPEIGMRPNSYRAAELIRHAASYFRDPRAQFIMGKMYADGDGVTRNRRLAVRWLLKASQKKYAPAQAYLGELLWKATDDEVMRARGLALLALAVDNADAGERGDIEARYHQAGRDAKSGEVERAERFVAMWDSLRSGKAEEASPARLNSGHLLGGDGAPSGSFVVSPEDDESTATDARFAMSGERDGPAFWTEEFELRSVYTGDGLGYDEMSEPTASRIVEQFFLNHPALQAGEDGDEPFSAEKVDRYGGETLSVVAGSPSDVERIRSAKTE